MNFESCGGAILLVLSGIRESDPLLILGKDAYYQCTNPAVDTRIVAVVGTLSKRFIMIKIEETMAKTATHFYIIRHGETEWNKIGRIQGHGDSPLTPAGITQAETKAQKLAQAAFDYVYSSDLGRAIQTAQIIAKPHGKQVIPKTEFREVSFGKFDGLNAKLYADQFHEQHEVRHKLSYEDSVHYRLHPSFETIFETAERMRQALLELHQTHTGNTVAVVTHGAVIRNFLIQQLRVHEADLPYNCIENAAHIHVELAEEFLVVDTDGVNLTKS